MAATPYSIDSEQRKIDPYRKPELYQELTAPLSSP